MNKAKIIKDFQVTTRSKDYILTKGVGTLLQEGKEDIRFEWGERNLTSHLRKSGKLGMTSKLYVDNRSQILEYLSKPDGTEILPQVLTPIFPLGTFHYTGQGIVFIKWSYDE